MNEALTHLMPIFQNLLPEILILFVSWGAYCYVLSSGFVSDDLQGILEYDGKLQGKEYGMISRWLRYHLAGGDFPSKKIIPGTNQPIPQGKIAVRHHILILAVFNIASILVFEFLKQAIGGKLALLAVLLFVVHPVGVQAVAWCSALGYPLSLLWIGAMLNLVLFHGHHNTPGWTILCTIAFCAFQFLGIHAQFIPMMTWAILLFLGYWQFAALGFVISSIMAFDIIKQTIDFRTTEFKKQNMGNSTFINPRKIIVALKTLWYYLRLTVWPNKMGLYHKWGFHYGPDLEREDRLFVCGLLSFVALVWFFCITDVFAVRLGILWFGAFIFIFLNWVTIQQFVTERYLFIPSLGASIVVAYLTQDQPLIYGFIFGALICRTWLHLPTYDNEMRFYQSNIWNFPESEVAYGNLGVTQMRMGLNGSAMDSWNMAAQINPDYDVPWYNMFSTFRANAMMSLQRGDYDACIAQLRAGLPYLQNTLRAKVCHFPDTWKKEQEELLDKINNPKKMLDNEKERLQKLLSDLTERLKTAKSPEELQGVQISINDAQNQLKKLEDYFTKNGLQ